MGKTELENIKRIQLGVTSYGINVTEDLSLKLQLL